MKLIFTLLIVLSATLVSAQDDSGQNDYNDFWNEIDSLFSDPEGSPIKDAGLESFDSIPRYAFDKNFRVEAEWTQLSDQETFYFRTTGRIKQEYQKAGIATFTIDSVVCELSVYRNIQLADTEGYEDYLFIPFTDLSNGFTTYGGGRYLSLHASPKESILIDFNQAYNPYCAYNDRYSCPIPPKENSLEIVVEAGARYAVKH